MLSANEKACTVHRKREIERNSVVEKGASDHCFHVTVMVTLQFIHSTHIFIISRFLSFSLDDFFKHYVFCIVCYLIRSSLSSLLVFGIILLRCICVCVCMTFKMCIRQFFNHSLRCTKQIKQLECVPH